MRHVFLICFGFVLAASLVVFLGMLFSPRLRPPGVVGLGIVVVLAIVWMFAMRRSRVPAQPDTGPRRPAAEDLDEATSLRNRPTWRDDLHGRVGPKW
jgi:hypothetical protein